MGETERYDKREDRANDIKRHDNPNHPSKSSHRRRLKASEAELKAWKRGEYKEP